ncbi:MAG: hypothetical protein ACYDBJ_08210 [Aggregatilineales bacterium]
MADDDHHKETTPTYLAGETAFFLERNRGTEIRLYDVTGQLPALVGEFPNNAGATWYVPGGKALARDTNGALGYFAYDGLGTARALFDTTGAQRDLTNYDPDGQVIEHSNDLTSHLGFTVCVSATVVTVGAVTNAATVGVAGYAIGQKGAQVDNSSGIQPVFRYDCHQVIQFSVLACT